MSKVVALLVTLILTTSLHELQAAQTGVASSPRITCQIEMASWCIASFGGPITMVTNDDQSRTWSLQDRFAMKDGPLKIIESGYCSGQFDSSPRLLARELMGGVSRRYNSAKYLVDTGDCVLEFQWPVSEQPDPAYEWTMLYGILVGGTPKATPLYKVAREPETCEPRKADERTVPPKVSAIPLSKEMDRESRVPPNGSAMVAVEVGVSGKVLHARIAQSSGHQIVDAAALDSIQRASFEPGTINGKRTAMCFQYRYTVKVAAP